MTDCRELDAFNRQLDATVPYKAHTAQYYSANNDFNDIREAIISNADAGNLIIHDAEHANRVYRLWERNQWMGE